MKKLLFLVLIAAALIFVGYFAVMGASGKEQVCFCHNVNHNPHTICTDNQGQINGHMGHVNNGEDTLGSCALPTVTPTVTLTATPTPTTEPECEEECVTETPTPTPTEEPRVTPTETPAPTETPKEEHGAPLSAPTFASCSELPPTMVQDKWYSDYKVAGNTAELTVHWGLNSEYPKVNIAYGENINEWRYAVLGVDNNGSYTIGSLKPNQSYWFQVAYVRGCAVGPYSAPFDP